MKMKGFDQLSWGSLTPYGITEKQLLMRSSIPSKSMIVTETEGFKPATVIPWWLTR